MTAINQYRVHSEMCDNWGCAKLHGAIEKRAEKLIGNNGRRELLESILQNEEAHIDWLEAKLDQIQQMGLPNYLVKKSAELVDAGRLG